MLDKEYVSITVANYALVEVISALAGGGIREYAITKEDDDLVLRISVDKLSQLKIKTKTRSYVSNGRNS